MVMPLKIGQWRRVLLETFRSKLCRAAWTVQQLGVVTGPSNSLILIWHRIHAPLHFGPTLFAMNWPAWCRVDGRPCAVWPANYPTPNWSALVVVESWP